MLFHAISAYSETSASAAISAAIGEASADYSKDAKSVHFIVSNVFQLGEGWKAIVRVIIEPDLEEKLERELKHEEYHEAKEEKKEREEGFDISLDIDVDVSADSFIEMGALSHSSEIPNNLEAGIGLIAAETKPNAADSLILHDVPSNEYTNKDAGEKRDTEVDFVYGFDNKELPLSVSEAQEVKKVLDQLRGDIEDIKKEKIEPSIYIYIPSTYAEIYDHLILMQLHAHIHLIEEGPLWDNIHDYFLDVEFYEATHTYELKQRRETVGSQFQDNIKRPQLKKKHKSPLDDLELEG